MQGRYDEQELATIKATFNNENLLRSLQKAFLQLPLTAVDLSNLSVNMNDKVKAIMRKMFLPQLTDNTNYNQMWDMTLSINVKDKMYEQVVLDIKSNDILIRYFDQQLKALEKGDYQKKQKIVLKKLTDLKDETDWNIYINVLARNNIIGTVAGRLNNLFLLAQPEKTPQQLKEEQEKNSSK